MKNSTAERRKSSYTTFANQEFLRRVREKNWFIADSPADTGEVRDIGPWPEVNQEGLSVTNASWVARFRRE